MRIQTFQIERFGCFTDQLLDLSSRSSNLHIIYGPNEAGKSTVLRAIVNMLYGIPAQTSDAFLYSYEDMRLTASLENQNGDLATFTRRKGNKATLLDASQQPVDEGVLAALLYGISMNAFTTMFGFDYQTLLEGRRDLREGKGDLAASLFEAGMGITGLRGVLDGLQKEKDGLFSPRANATSPMVNAALRRYKESMNSVRELSVRPRDWHKLDAEIGDIGLISPGQRMTMRSAQPTRRAMSGIRRHSHLPHSAPRSSSRLQSCRQKVFSRSLRSSSINRTTRNGVTPCQSRSE